MIMDIMRDIDKMEKEKYYISSDGTKTKLKDIETTHLINSLAKKQRDIFSLTDKDKIGKALQEISDLKEEYHKRFNDFYEKVGDNNGK